MIYLQLTVYFFSDTDSVIFLSSSQENATSTSNIWEPEIGNTLGILSDQLAKEEFISRFQAIAPKNYHLEIKTEKDPLGPPVRTELKCKGQMLTSEIHDAIDGEICEALIFHRIPEIQKFYENLKQGKYQPEKQVEHARALFERFREESGQQEAALFLPNPTLVRNKMTGQIFEDKYRIRLMKSQFDKRRLFLECGNDCMPSIPFGFCQFL